MDFLKSELSVNFNTTEIIDISYDLQAGSYIENFHENRDFVINYTDELRSNFDGVLSPGDSLLDVGTGEMTTLTLLLSKLNIDLSRVLALDISWSRLHEGITFFNDYIESGPKNLFPFVGKIQEIPLPSKSVDVITSNHALEPNRGNLESLLTEMYRICRKRLILFEPHYEINSDEGKKRMDKLGYIKDIENTIEKTGGNLISITPLKNVINKLNPTTCFVISPPEAEKISYSVEQISNFSIPGTSYLLEEDGTFFVSKEVGVAYPILRGIPVLKNEANILASKIS